MDVTGYDVTGYDDYIMIYNRNDPVKKLDMICIIKPTSLVVV